MDPKMKRPAWMEDELVKNIDQKKLNFLEKIFAEGQGRNQKDMMSYLMPMMRKAKQEHLTFTPQEMTAAVNAIKNHSTEEELSKIEKILEKSKNGGK